MPLASFHLRPVYYYCYLLYALIARKGVVGNDTCYGKAITACGNGMKWDLAMEVFNGAESHGVVRGAVSAANTSRRGARVLKFRCLLYLALLLYCMRGMLYMHCVRTHADRTILKREILRMEPVAFQRCAAAAAAKRFSILVG